MVSVDTSVEDELPEVLEDEEVFASKHTRSSDEDETKYVSEKTIIDE